MFWCNYQSKLSGLRSGFALTQNQVSLLYLGPWTPLKMIKATDPLLRDIYLRVNFGKQLRGIHWIQKANYKPQVKNSETKWKKLP